MAGSSCMNLVGKSYWSNSSIIHPSITGLHNGDCLSAFVNLGIYAGVILILHILGIKKRKVSVIVHNHKIFANK